MPYNTPLNLRFGGGASDSLIHPLVIIVLLLALPAILLIRRQMLCSLMFPLCLLIPVGQQVVIGGLHVMVIRIIIVTGMVRALTDQGWKPDGLNRLFVVWAIVRSSAFVLTTPEMGAVIIQLGFLLETLGGFFFLRFLIQSYNDIERVVRALAGVAIVLAACMLNEHFTQVNIFGYLGGVPLTPEFKAGLVRAQGPFPHGLLAGTFGATALPLFVWLWLSGKSQKLAVAGLFASVVITAMSASSTPVLVLLAATLGILLWPVRNYVIYLRWGCVLLMCVLSLVMKAPIWFLLAKIDLTGKSSGYHRALLVDTFIKHFGDWWFIGTSANGTWGWDLWDTCNQFVTEGIMGGLVTLACFVTIIVLLFRRLAEARRRFGVDRRQQWFFWLLTVTLFTHSVAFFGIVYFGQMRWIWYSVLAMLIAATSASAANASDSEVASVGSAITEHGAFASSETNVASKELQWFSPDHDLTH